MLCLNMLSTEKRRKEGIVHKTAGSRFMEVWNHQQLAKNQDYILTGS